MEHKLIFTQSSSKIHCLSRVGILMICLLVILGQMLKFATPKKFKNLMVRRKLINKKTKNFQICQLEVITDRRLSITRSKLDLGSCLIKKLYPWSEMGKVTCRPRNLLIVREVSQMLRTWVKISSLQCLIKILNISMASYNIINLYHQRHRKHSLTINRIVRW